MEIDEDEGDGANYSVATSIIAGARSANLWELSIAGRLSVFSSRSSCCLRYKIWKLKLAQTKNQAVGLDQVKVTNRRQSPASDAMMSVPAAMVAVAATASSSSQMRQLRRHWFRLDWWFKDMHEPAQSNETNRKQKAILWHTFSRCFFIMHMRLSLFYLDEVGACIISSIKLTVYEIPSFRYLIFPR